ncbi:two-component system, response regulator YesN [Fontibacillus panacisegetis]|uniref:Two-component system, response regulator YesN n=1 Tax=Fontibacillus panacisegetis TaxID=670482 RepID=A0A1G7MB97_9BACL|nr:response regulator [Fontibacillus panacisegetis]SDF59043.1 two-component system, response regulator YesN [Fontibacillus panacisegetis]
MYKVLIIDDEEPLREAISILGDWKGLQVSSVLEATNGKSGLEMIESHRPDLVVVDMKMPEMNGVEFLRVVEKQYPELLTIVISGYNDFEFTRQAIHSKVVDYLLKPINRQDLNQTLRKAIDLLEAKREIRQESITKNIAYNMSLPKLKEKIYFSIIEGSFKKGNNHAFLSLIGGDDPNHRFGALVLRVLNMEGIRDSRFNHDVELLYFAVENVINEMSGDGLQCFSFVNPKQEREIIAIYTISGGYPQDWTFRSEQLMKQVVSNLSKLFGILSAGGVGHPCSDPLELAHSYEAARLSVLEIDLLKMKGSGVIGTHEKLSVRDIHSLTSRMPIIRNALESGNLNHARTVLGEFARKVQSSDSFSLGDADRMIREVVVLFNDIALELGVPADSTPPSSGERALRALGVGTDFSTFEQFEHLLMKVLERYSTQIREKMAGNRPFSVDDIKEYIDNHYFEDIKISMFTEKYFLSREYLMKLFKQQFGFGIHEYVQKVRMDKAQKLLDDPGLKIQDISDMLGYKDKNYFSKAFRNYYSISPSEYRNQIIKDKK